MVSMLLFAQDFVSSKLNSCEPCKHITPTFEALSDQTTELTFLIVDVDDQAFGFEVGPFDTISRLIELEMTFFVFCLYLVLERSWDSSNSNFSDHRRRGQSG
jgi:thiol-disulfide isomerase/thioredoxin